MNRRPLVSVTMDDLEMQTFRSGGKGGQNQNKVNSGVRLIHHPSGARGECRNFREQHRNKVEAFRRLAESDKFKAWLRIASAKAMGQETPEEAADRAMAAENLKVEVRNERGQWVAYTHAHATKASA